MKGSVRKSCLKRTFAFVSALSMIGSFSNAIGASEVLSDNIISASATEDGENNLTTQDVTEGNGEYSRIDVEISNQFDFLNEVDCTVSVIRVHSDGTLTDVLSDAVVTLGGEKNSTAVVSTDYIENGDYIVEVSAPGFKKFKQEISNFDNMVCTVKVTLGFKHGYAYTDTYQTDENGEMILNEDGDPVLDKARGDHPGAMIVGDVNGDGEITGRDEELLLKAIDFSIRNDGNVDIELNDDEILFSDMNHDGITNLADLTFFTRGYIDTKDWETQASLVKAVSDKYVAESIKEVKPLEGTKSNGVTMADLIKKSDKNEEDDNENEETEQKVMELGATQQAVDENGDPMFDENGEPVMEECEISEEHPVGVAMDFEGAQFKEVSFETNAESGSLEVQLSEDEEPIEVPFNKDADALNESDVRVTIDENGNISLDLGNQIAVKKITLKITKAKNTKLAEIGTVEFLNGMEERIAEPEIDFPTNVKVEQDRNVRDKDAKIIATWDKPLNGGDSFEFEVSTSSATKADGSFVSTIPGVQNTVVTDPTFMLQSEHGNFKLIKINTTYYVHVRCIADDYKSKWSDYAKVTTESNSVPDKPDYVNAKGEYKSMKVTWGSDNTNTTKGYKLYYKKSGTDQYEEIDVGKSTSYTLVDLEDLTEYEVYVKGYNDKGISPESVHSKSMTTTSNPVQMIKYKAINCDDEGNLGSAHIVSVTRNGGDMANNDKDFITKEKRQLIEKEYNNVNNNAEATRAEKNAALAKRNEELAKLPFTAWGVVDGDQSSYYAKTTWDDGGFNNLGGNGITVEFDDEYSIGSVAVSRPYGGTNFTYTKVRYWDADGKEYSINDGGYIYGSTWTLDVNKNGYYIIKFPYEIKAKKIQIGFANAWVQPNLIAIAEMCFYPYDHTMSDIMNLYVDNLHTVLRDDVTQETIDELRERINEVDVRNGEINPNAEALNRELDTAEKILNAEQISTPVLIHTGITSKDVGINRKLSGLNAWQPLGVSIGTDTEVTIYVGSPSKKSGEATDLRLIATQYNSESNGVVLEGANLVVGANTFNLTKGNIAGAEAGGALYIQYQGNVNANIQYSVRVTGGTEVPMLDLYKVTDREERLNRAADYIKALDEYVPVMEEEHNKAHKGATFKGQRNTKLDYDYNEKTCIAGASDILCDTMMYSLPAPQILAGLGKGSVEDRAEKLVQSMDSMEDMMKLFYQHKGISPDAENAADRTPDSHLNIRYQRMFSGASMYAAGNHIGIQWGTASSMVNSKGVEADENGKYVSGSYFGWGIAHEIGHNINDSSYVLAEITNNYFALLAQSQDTNKGSRLNYNNIYKKVTSNTKGNADQGTQLGMYWQLHLAYDKDFNFKTYDTNEDILNNLFYARMDTYSRNPGKAPKPHDIALTLGGGTDQQLMRLACAAAEKNVLEFFERWGKTPDATTRTYASQFPKETRAIMYANEDSRVYAMTGESSLASEDGNAVAVIDNVKVSVGTGTKANKVELSISVSDKINENDILGYEIVRCTISGGDVKETPIAFVTSPNYTDKVTSFNNRTVSYKVTLIDQYLNRSEVFATEMVKIQHDGSLDKSNWTITTETGNRYFTAPMITHEASEDELPCEHTVINPVIAAIDDNLETVYEANVTGTPSIYINFNQPLVVSGMKYTSGTTANDPISYFIYVKNDATGAWQHVATGSFNGSGVVYFANSDNKYISTYETSEIRLQFTNQGGKTISIAELDVLGVTGDNVDFRKDGESAEAAFGILSADYKYGTKDEDFIPEGSLVFTGSYKGNPAYNAVILFDENGDIVGGTGVDDEGKAQQIILADVPDGSLITDVSNGTWVYWINPEDIPNMVWPEKVRVELYRVNNALTNEGQRIVSDSLFETIAAKDDMSPITIGGSRKYTTEDTTEVTTEGGDTE